MKLKFAIIHDSKHGQTEMIGQRIATVLNEHGHDAQVHHLHDVTDEFPMDELDAVVLGCPMHLEKFSAAMSAFVIERIAEINRIASFFYSVSLSAAGDEHGLEQVQNYVEQFLGEADWDPDGKANFAGALPYQDYNPILRWIMKRIVRKAGGETDTTHNYEYTDWVAVEDFALECAQRALSLKEERGSAV